MAAYNKKNKFRDIDNQFELGGIHYQEYDALDKITQGLYDTHVTKINGEKVIYKEKVPSGFSLQHLLSDDLCVFLGLPRNSIMSRVAVTTKINEYIKANNLQDPTKNRIILPDEPLKKLLKIPDGTEPLTYFNLQKYLQPCFIKVPNVMKVQLAYSPDPDTMQFLDYSADAIAQTIPSYKWPNLYHEDIEDSDDEGEMPVNPREYRCNEVAAGTIILDYIAAKNLKKTVVTYDQPLFEMLGLGVTDELNYDDLPRLVREKFYKSTADV